MHLSEKITILLLILSLSACSLYDSAFETETVKIILPSWPPEDGFSHLYPALYGWDVKITGSGLTERKFVPASGREASAGGLSGTATLTVPLPGGAGTATTTVPFPGGAGTAGAAGHVPGGAGTAGAAGYLPGEAGTARAAGHVPEATCAFTLERARNRTFAISARPVTLSSSGECTLFFHPAGAVYPALCRWTDSEGPVLEVSYKEGFSAFLFEGIWKSSIETGYSREKTERFVSAFNWKHLSDYINGNPWLADSEKILSRIMSGNFSATVLSASGTAELPVKDFSPEERLLSPYIPENTQISESGNVSLSKTAENPFLSDSDHLLLIRFVDSKKTLTEYVLIPKMKMVDRR